jgi:hypothetical protein
VAAAEDGFEGQLYEELREGDAEGGDGGGRRGGDWVYVEGRPEEERCAR